MALSGTETAKLANELSEVWDQETLTLFASDYFDINLDKLAPGADLKERAFEFINELSSRRFPPRDGELLEKLRACKSIRLKHLANELLKPMYFSPTNDPHDAVVLGREAFVDRAELRKKIRDFTNPSPYTTRVLIIRGDEPCGKSYSWSFLRHLAVSTVGVMPQRLPLEGTSYTPRQLFEQIFRLLNMDLKTLPSTADDPQYAQIDPFINALKGQVPLLQRRDWLVIDDINDPSVTPHIRESTFAIASSIEDLKSDNLWIALLGYNALITKNTLRFVAQDDARFPDAGLLAEHFLTMANAGPKPLALRQAHEYAALLLTKFPVLTKEAMTSLTPLIEDFGEKLKLGQRP
jgi:hypothetical protein